MLVESISIRDEGLATRRHVPIQIRRAKREIIVNKYLLLAEPLCVAKVTLHLRLSVVWTRSAHSHQFPAILEPLAPWRLAPPERDMRLSNCNCANVHSLSRATNKQTDLVSSPLVLAQPFEFLASFATASYITRIREPGLHDTLRAAGLVSEGGCGDCAHTLKPSTFQLTHPFSRFSPRDTKHSPPFLSPRGEASSAIVNSSRAIHKQPPWSNKLKAPKPTPIWDPTARIPTRCRIWVTAL